MSDIQVKATPQFQRNLRKLAQKYLNIRKDIEPILERLQKGEKIGDRIPKMGYEVFKIRVKNSNIQKGKSGGYRLIYYLKTPQMIILLTIYSKSQQADIAAHDIEKIISEYEADG